jgi:hypothetical protein
MMLGRSEHATRSNRKLGSIAWLAVVAPSAAWLVPVLFAGRRRDPAEAR